MNIGVFVVRSLRWIMKVSMLMDEYWGFCGEIFKMDYEGELVRLFDLDSLLQR